MVVVAATTLSISAVADHDEIDVSFEVLQARLMGEGYNSIKMVNANPLQLSAFDREGSEVFLSINPQTGETDSTEYARWVDR